jgi:hypothetical protein
VQARATDGVVTAIHYAADKGLGGMSIAGVPPLMPAPLLASVLPAVGSNNNFTLFFACAAALAPGGALPGRCSPAEAGCGRGPRRRAAVVPGCGGPLMPLAKAVFCSLACRSRHWRR